MLKGILLGAGMVLLLVAAIGGTVLYMQPDESTALELQPGMPGAALPLESRPTVFYHHVQPEFIANLPSSGSSRQPFALVEMSVAVNDEEALAILEANGPELRNDILMMLGEQSVQSLTGNEGKTALRAKASEIADVLLTKHYAAGRVLDVYLTRFVLQ